MKYAIILTVFILLSSTGYPDTINVPGDYPTIQEAIDAAMTGDTVLVAPGTYAENIDFLGKDITVKSSEGAESTIIDGMESGSVVTFDDGETSQAALEGFTITNGSADKGGGICCLNGSSPFISSNIIKKNRLGEYSKGGAGIYCGHSSPIIKNNKFIKNTRSYIGHGSGGGIYCDNADTIIENNYFNNNEAGSAGGGIYGTDSNLIIANNFFQSNKVDHESGGGIFCRDYSGPNDEAVIVNNIFWKNSCFESGGAICCTWNGLIYNNTIFENTANRGGGISCAGSKVINNTIINNSAWLDGGGGISCFWNTDIRNTILRDNSAEWGPEIYIYHHSNKISFSNVQGGQDSVFIESGGELLWGPGMIDADPLFVDPANNDFHLTFNSPCRGSGDNAAPGLPDHDFEGDPRIWQQACDIGADEFHTHLYYTGKSKPGEAIEGKLIGLPGTSPTVLWFGLAGVLDNPVQTQYGLWYLKNPWIHAWLMQSIPTNGVLSIPVTIPANPEPYEVPIQGLVGLQSDSLTNLCILIVK
jgi:predicted outer membrane repeat protein